MVADDLQFGECALLHERAEHLLAAYPGTVPLDLADRDVIFPGRDLERDRDIRTGRQGAIGGTRLAARSQAALPA